MRQFLRILLSSALGLTAVTVMLTTVQAPAAPINDQDQVQKWSAVTASPPATFLLAQNDETLKQKPASPSPNEPRKLRKKSAAPPAPMERQDSKSPVFGDDPERAGTKKLGGQIIRGQEGPGGE